MVPNGWEIKQLADLTTKISDGIHSTPKYTEKSDIHFINGNNLKNGSITISSTTKKVCPEDAENHRRDLSDRTILMSINGTIGNLAFYNNENVVLGKSACYINVNHDVDIKYIYYTLDSSKTQAFYTTELTGSTIKNLSLKTIKSTKILTPPLQEQQKIAKILTTWDKAINTTERLIDNSKQQKKALMQQLLTGKKRLLDDNGKRFEGEWEEVKLEDICLINPKKPTEPKDGKVSFIPMDALSEDAKLIKQDIKDYKDVSKGFTSFTDNDVLIAKITPCFENGKGAFVEGLTNGVGFGSTEFHVLRADKDTCPKFIYYLSLTDIFRGRGKLNMQGSAGHRRVTTDYIKAYKLTVPPSLEEQQKIAAVLTNADKEIELLEQQLADLQQEKKALMQVLLTGKKRVVVDRAVV